MYDALRREWAVEILRELDLPAEILPPVHTGPVVVGTLGDQVRRRTGLGEVPVVAGAGHDTGAAFGICRGDDLPPPEDLVVISSGTWAILGIFVDEHLPAGTVDPLQFGYEANPDGSLRLIRNLTAGWLIEQCRKAWDQRGQDLSYDALIAAARAASGSKGASAIVDPQWKGFVHPEDMPAAIGDYCHQTGQPAPQQPGEFAQVIFASLADSYARAIEQLRRMTGRTLGNVYVIGGMTRNAYLNELTAEKCRANVLAGPAEATALGNIAVQAAAVG
jgi:rhamnulokinase